MTNADAIFADFHNYSLGQPLRIEFVASESSATKARALSALRQKVLSVVVYSGADEKQFCSMTATLPHKADGELIQRCIVPYGGKRVKVILDVSPQDHKTLLWLIEEFYGQPKTMRLEFHGESDLPVKEKREAKPQKAKGDHGSFWQKMVKSSAYDCRDLQAWIEVDGRDAVHDALRAAFGVASLTFVSPREAVAKFEMANLPGIAAVARRLGESDGK